MIAGPTVRNLLATMLAGALVVLSGCQAPGGPDGEPAATGDSSEATTDATPSSPPTSASEDATTRSPSPTRQPRPSRIVPVPPRQWRAMQAAGMVRPECPVQRRSQLRRVELNHVDFGGRTRRGHLIVRHDTATSVKRIFDRLFDIGFPIRRMVGVERYGGDVNRSLRADNTSAFNCRRSDQINAPFGKSPHANGRAIDINPRENPWRDPRCRCWSPGPRHAERTPGPGKILRGGPVWQLFRDEGWIWQNIDVADYMHFDTGYPSKPYGRTKRQQR